MIGMRKLPGVALFAAMMLLFLIANRGAYQGYFDGDALNNLSWTQHVPLADFAIGFISPRFYPHNFRPAGHLYFSVMARLAGLDFPWYVATMHALHFLNVWLVWLLLRRLGLAPLAAGSGALFFAFHIGVFDAYWKPMYVFDVLCAAFSLLSLLAYIDGGILPSRARKQAALLGSLLFFWLAYKAKEPAVMLPAVLVAYEYWLGEKNWKRLIPFFAVSLCFGLQALWASSGRETEYALRFAPAEVWKTAAFYSSKVFLLPYAGFAVLALPLVTRDRRAWLGLAAFCLLLAPMLFLPGRLFGAYLYLPLAGLAVAFAALVAGRHPALVAGFFLLWIPWNYSQLRVNRREALSLADESRRYVAGLHEVVRANPQARAFIYDGVPAALHSWGIEGAVRYLYRRGDIEFYPAEGVDLQKALGEGAAAVLLSWDPARRELSAFSRPPGAPDASYITMSRLGPVWQLGQGWYAVTGHFRWTRPYATARLHRPARTTAFELVVNMGPPPAGAPLRASVFLNGQALDARELVRGSGFQTVRWPLAPGAEGPVRLEFRAEPPFLSDGSLGLAVAAFGFLPREGS